MTSFPSCVLAMHFLEVRTRGLLVEARLNDIPVFTENAGRGRLFQVKCEPYLVNGENELRVWLRLPGGVSVGESAGAEDPADGAEEWRPAREPHCRVRVVRLDPPPGEGNGAIADASADSQAVPPRATSQAMPAGGSVGRSDAPYDAPQGVNPPARHLTSYTWDPTRDLLLPGRAFEAGPWFFFAESPGGRWSWETAPVFQPAGEDPAEIRVLVEKLWRAVAFRDADAVVHLTKEKTRELAVALGVNAGELESDQASYLVSLFTSPNWTIAPLEQDGLVLEPAARGRLVEIRTVDGEAPIRGGDGARAFVLRPMVARIDGRWRIVR